MAKAELSLPSLEQHLSALRRLFDWWVTGGVLDANPFASVRLPRSSQRTGQTLVLFAEALDAYVAAAVIAGDRDWPLFRRAAGRTGQQIDRPIRRIGVRGVVKNAPSPPTSPLPSGRTRFGPPASPTTSATAEASRPLPPPQAALWPDQPSLHVPISSRSR